MSNKFNITDNRLVVVRDMLEKQHTLQSIGVVLGVSADRLGVKLKDLGIDVEGIRNGARLNMRSNMMSTIELIRDPKKKVDAYCQFLDRYPIAEAVVDDVDVIDVDVITAKIMGELDDD